MNLALTSKTPELSVELISNNTFLNLNVQTTTTDSWPWQTDLKQHVLEPQHTNNNSLMIMTDCTVNVKRVQVWHGFNVSHRTRRRWWHTVSVEVLRSPEWFLSRGVEPRCISPSSLADSCEMIFCRTSPMNTCNLTITSFNQIWYTRNMLCNQKENCYTLPVAAVNM